MKNLILASVFTFCSLNAFADARVAEFKSTGGTQFKVSYLPLPVENGNTVGYAAISMSMIPGSDIDGTYYLAGATLVSNCGGSVTVTKLDLPSYGGGFGSKNPVQIPYFNHSGPCGQEVAVQVNGKWLTDPVNGTHNFKYQMLQ